MVLGPWRGAMAEEARAVVREGGWVEEAASAEEAAALLTGLGPARVLLKGSRGARLETIIEACRRALGACT